MLDCKNFFEHIKKCGVDFFSGVPDSLLKDFCAYLSDNAPASSHIIAANEGGAVGLALGHYLATGNPGLVYMQNSGQGNATNPLVSLADNDVYGIPMLLLVGWRGEPGSKDEPQHVKQGKITQTLFDTMGISCSTLPKNKEDAEVAVKNAIAQTKKQNQPVALLVQKDTFAPYTLQNTVTNSYAMTREDAISNITKALGKTSTIVATTGKASRELYETRDAKGESHAPDFLTVGGMGHASQIALGIALSKPERTVCCLDGDGAALMHMGGLGIVASQQASNYKHILLNNGVHDSVGGQPTIGFSVDFCAIARAVGYDHVFKVESLAELNATLPEFIKTKKTAFIEVRVATGARENLGRPKSTPAQNKQAFMKHLDD